MKKTRYSHPTQTFRTHASYIRAFARLVAPGAASPMGALDRVAELMDQAPTVRGSPADLAGALRSLGLAWRTELLLDVTSGALEDDELVRLANTWAVVQVYYVFYHSTQALAQAKGFNRTPSHPQTQKMFKDFWADRALCVPPWTLSWGENGCSNLPEGLSIDDTIHAWSSCNDLTCWSLAAKALRTTRDYAVAEALAQNRRLLQKERRKKWEEQETERRRSGRKARRPPRFARPQLRSSERAATASRVRPHTLMDYLYRLRVRTNYEDSAMFTDGPENRQDSQEVRDNLRLLASSTMLLHELAIIDIVGSDRVLTEAQRFISTTAPEADRTSLKIRLGLLESHRTAPSTET